LSSSEGREAEVMQPLTGMMILELGTFITAPYAGMLMADLGAEIIKVERPGLGDPFRSFEGGLYSPHFRAYNRSKKSLTLDITRPDGRRVLEQLLERADALVENFRPGFLDGLGFGDEELLRLNPRLVYCSITGFGADGPYRSRPSYDTVGQALSGLLSLYVDPENPRLTGTAISDMVTGLYAGYALLAGLMQRERTGRGVRVETSMIAATMSILGTWLVEHGLTGVVPGIYRKSEVNLSFCLRCADDKLVAIHLSSPEKFWAGLVAALEAPELATDPRFAERMARTKHYEELRAELSARFVRQPRRHWLNQLEAHDVPFAPVYSLDDLRSDPQVAFLGLFQELVHPVEGTTQIVKRPVWLDGDTGSDAAFAPPQLGEHSDGILASLGYARADIDRLRTAKIV
jgi:crotonobetainyl-CoA:carnitine CoA-transferase CaiB-like acyl-CoA transferase